MRCIQISESLYPYIQQSFARKVKILIGLTKDETFNSQDVETHTVTGVTKRIIAVNLCSPFRGALNQSLLRGIPVSLEPCIKLARGCRCLGQVQFCGRDRARGMWPTGACEAEWSGQVPQLKMNLARSYCRLDSWKHADTKKAHSVS